MNPRIFQEQGTDANRTPPLQAAAGLTLAVVDPAGIHGVGLCDMLARAGFTCRLLRRDVEATPSAPTIAVVDTPGTRIPTLRARVGPQAPIVAVLREPSHDAYAQAIVAGADGVLGCDCNPGDLIHTVRAAAAKRFLLPANVARELARSYKGPPVVLSEAELRWLSAMNQGTALAAIAAREGSPAGELAQALRKLYARLRVSGRVEALDHLVAIGMLSRPTEVDLPPRS